MSATAEEVQVANIKDAATSRIAPLHAPTDPKSATVQDIAGALNMLLADMFALYLKTKNFQWHMSGPHFHDYRVLLDEQGDQIFATADAIVERVSKIGGKTLRSIGHIGRLQRVLDNDADFVTPLDMLAELRDDDRDSWWRACARRMAFAVSMATLRAQACWKTGSTRPSGERRFFPSRAAFGRNKQCPLRSSFANRQPSSAGGAREQCSPRKPDRLCCGHQIRGVKTPLATNN